MIFQINVVMKTGGDIFLEANDREEAEELARKLIENGTYNASSSDLYPEDVEILFTDEAKPEDVDHDSLKENTTFLEELADDEA